MTEKNIAEMLWIRKRYRNIKPVRWYRLWIARAVLLSALIVLGGYLASIVAVVQGVNAISRLAFAGDVDSLFIAHGGSMKMLAQLRQEVLLGRLKKALGGEIHGSPDTLRAALIKAHFGDYIDLQGYTIVPYDTEEKVESQEEPGGEVYWLNPSKLRVGGLVVRFAADSLRKEVIAVQEIAQRYQGIKVLWNAAIKPSLVKQQLVILCAMTLFLALGMLFMVRTFKARIDDLLEGVMTWSHTDSTFRFSSNFSGELKMITDQFNTMADEMEINRRKNIYLEKMASWQIIARKLAHEIKNPLTPIQMMMAQLVRGYAGDDEKYKVLLASSSRVINEEVAALRRMVDSFSEFARLPEPKMVTCDLNPLCIQVVGLQKAVFANHDIQFESTLPEANACFDPQLIKQVLLNLVKNAAEACGHNLNAKIVLRLEKEKSSYRLHVIDNGPGIPKEMQKRVFEAYFTTKHSGPSPGMGLGLSICQKIILDHKGDMLVDSVPGRTDFQVILPLVGNGGLRGGG